MLKVGDRVRLKKSSQYYPSQGMHGNGKIRSIGRIGCNITFDDGYENYYILERDVEPAVDTEAMLKFKEKVLAELVEGGRDDSQTSQGG